MIEIPLPKNGTIRIDGETKARHALILTINGNAIARPSATVCLASVEAAHSLIVALIVECNHVWPEKPIEPKRFGL